MARIVVVDDDEQIRQTSVRLLSAGGRHQVVDSFASGLDLIRALDNWLDNTVDIIVCDYSMPGGMNGLEVAAVCRSQFSHIPFILYTASPPKRERATAADARLIDQITIIEKPARINELFDCIERLTNSV